MVPPYMAEGGLLELLIPSIHIPWLNFGRSRRVKTNLRPLGPSSNLGPAFSCYWSVSLSKLAKVTVGGGTWRSIINYA